MEENETKCVYGEDNCPMEYTPCEHCEYNTLSELRTMEENKIFEIKITIDQIELHDSLELLEMFKTMCAYSGCTYSTYQLHNNPSLQPAKGVDSTLVNKKQSDKTLSNADRVATVQEVRRDFNITDYSGYWSKLIVNIQAKNTERAYHWFKKALEEAYPKELLDKKEVSGK